MADTKVRGDEAGANVARTIIRTPDQRLRVFVSSTLYELAEERAAAREAITKLRFTPVLFELGARPHPPRELYRAYLDQSHIFVAIYWQRYGWIAPDMDISGLEDEYQLSGRRPKLIYIKEPAPEREPRLTALIDQIIQDSHASFRPFANAVELRDLLENDLALLLSERFETFAPEGAAVEAASSSNLPVSTTSVVGREQDVVVVHDLLAEAAVRLVTLTGPGGIGKTRLALEVAGKLLSAFEDGVFLVELANVADPPAVAQTIAYTLGLKEAQDRSILESLHAYLKDRQMLLVLDNFEQVLAAAPLLADLLKASPRLEMLVTSRTLLHLYGEHEYPVPPLALPDLKATARTGTVEELSAYSSVALFVQRARAAKPSFQLTDETAPVVARICVLLDGLPLAIELAAARVKVFSPHVLLQRLDNRLALLTGGARELTPRQQTMRGAIEWSWSLLDAEERSLFARLGVFAGGFSVEAAEVVGSPGDALILDALVSLVDKSFLRQVEWCDDGIPAEPRFVMLGTLREYALEQLRAMGAEEDVRRKHAHYFVRFADQAQAELGDAREEALAARMEEDHENFRAALRWALEPGGDLTLALRLSSVLWPLWATRGYLSEGRAILTETLERTRGFGDGLNHFRAAAAFGSGNLAWAQGDLVSARTFTEESLALRRNLGDVRGVAASLNNLGLVLRDLGDVGAARSVTEESLALRRELGDARGVGWALHNLGALARMEGDYARARSLAEEALALRRSKGNRYGVAASLGSLAKIARDEGDFAKAKKLALESLQIRRDLGDTQGIANCLEIVGEVTRRQGDGTRAVRFFAFSARLREVLQAPLPPAERLRYEQSLAQVRAEMGESAFQAAWAAGRAMTLEQAARAVAEGPG